MLKLIAFAAAAAAALAACSSDHPIAGPAASLRPSFSTSAPASVTNSGFYDHQIIEYQGTAEVTSSPQAAQLISKAMWSSIWSVQTGPHRPCNALAC